MNNGQPAEKPEPVFSETSHEFFDIVPTISPEEAAAHALVGEPLRPESFDPLTPDTSPAPSTTPEASRPTPEDNTNLATETPAPPEESPSTPEPDILSADLTSDAFNLDFDPSTLTDKEGIGENGKKAIDQSLSRLDATGDAKTFYEEMRSLMGQNVSHYDNRGQEFLQNMSSPASTKSKKPSKRRPH